MNGFATLRKPALASAAFALLGFALFAPRASAQVDPLWDHYKAYRVMPNPLAGLTLGLRDQFGLWQHQVHELSYFANPVEKQLSDGTVSPINDPRLHYAWWVISPQPIATTVAASNQFGDFMFSLSNARYLWNPALKNEPGAPPIANHYKCYDCQGPPVNRGVTLTDQFGIWQTTVTVPRLFCNPVEKILPTGNFPIIDPRQHYVCYEFNPVDPRTFSAFFTDQFITDFQMVLGPSDLLCVPTDKVDPTSTDAATWGRLKMIYR